MFDRISHRGRFQLIRSLSLALAAFSLAGCQTQTGRNFAISSLDATLWAQSAAEHEAACLSVFANAKRMLEVHLQDPAFVCAVEQEGDLKSKDKRPAIVLDIDETILNNVAFQAECIRRGTNYDLTLWKKWVEQAQAAALPGAVDFCRFAKGKNVEIIYVTNRGEKCGDAERGQQRIATKVNLEKLGFPVGEPSKSILMPGDRLEWTTDKTLRRRSVADEFRIVALLGDDLADFLDVNKRTSIERANLVSKYQGRWGTSWFILPNPMYGSWMRTVLREAPRDAQELERWKVEQLQPMVHNEN